MVFIEEVYVDDTVLASSVSAQIQEIKDHLHLQHFILKT